MRTAIKPRVTAETAAYWQGCSEDRLQAQSCDDCGALRFPPQPMCPKCNSMRRSWQEIEGKGHVYTYSVITGKGPEAPLPGAHGFPYGVVIVELESGVRMVTDVDTEQLEGLEVGTPVEVVFEQIDDDLTVPRFVPSAG